MLLSLLICKWTTCKLTLSRVALQFQWSKRKQILTTERAIHEDTDYYGGPPTFTKEKGELNWQKSLERSVQYDVFSSPNPGKCHNTEGWRAFCFGLPAWPRLCTSRPQALSTLNVPIPRKVQVLSQNGFQICNQRKKKKKKKNITIT
jgi:hypothetical protein